MGAVTLHAIARAGDGHLREQQNRTVGEVKSAVGGERGYRSIAEVAANGVAKRVELFLACGVRVEPLFRE